jgi:hypothetical protein
MGRCQFLRFWIQFLIQISARSRPVSKTFLSFLYWIHGYWISLPFLRVFRRQANSENFCCLLTNGISPPARKFESRYCRFSFGNKNHRSRRMIEIQSRISIGGRSRRAGGLSTLNRKLLFYAILCPV